MDPTTTPQAVLTLGLFLMQQVAVQSSYGPDIHHCPENRHESAHFSWDCSSTFHEKVIVVVNPAGQEVLMWVFNATTCSVQMDGAYASRSSHLCDTNGNQLLFNITRLETADEGNYSCHDGAVVGALIPDCGQRLIFQEVQRLSRKCQYLSAARKVTCHGVVLEQEQTFNIQDFEGKTIYWTQSRDPEYLFPGNVHGNLSCLVTGPSACSNVFSMVVQSGSLPVSSSSILVLVTFMFMMISM